MATAYVLGVFFLFLFQLLTEFVAAIYAFGLLGTSIPPQIGAVVLLLSPLALMGWRRAPRWLLPTSLVGVALSRLLLPWLPTGGVLWVGGLGTAMALLAWPLLLRRFGAGESALGLAWAVAAAGLCRALGAGVDCSLEGGGQVVGVLLALTAAWAAWRILPRAAAGADESAADRPPFLHILRAALGLASVLFLLLAAFVAPAVVARWAGWSPFAAYGLAGVALMAWASRVGNLRAARGGGRFTLPLALALFALFLAWGIAALQTPFPMTAEAYPLPRQPAGPAPGLVLALLAFPLLFWAFESLHHALRREPADLRREGAAFGLAGGYLLLLVLAHVFTTTYDYIPLVGAWFRGKFWVVYAVPAAVVVWAVAGAGPPQGAASRLRRGGWVLAGLAVAMIAAAWLRRPTPPLALPASDTLRVLTYNVQQGYRADGQKGWRDQLAVMRSQQPDIIGLQETDTARLSGANNDLVGYWATALHMVAYYGPPTVDGTFGLALLSRYPIVEAQTVYLYSTGEQTAAILATVLVGRRQVHVAVTHLGNDGPLVQQQNVLQAVRGLQPLVLMGDFNFRADTLQYRLTVQQLRAAATPLPQAIDHIFVTPDVGVLQAEYQTSPASDHPALWATLRLP